VPSITVKFISKNYLLAYLGVKIMTNDEIINLLKKIDTKLGLILGNQIAEKETNIKLQVAKLSKSNLDYTEIAEILGISSSHASKELSILRKVKKNGNKSEE
jgi:predicted HTH domain antitoxin